VRGRRVISVHRCRDRSELRAQASRVCSNALRNHLTSPMEARESVSRTREENREKLESSIAISRIEAEIAKLEGERNRLLKEKERIASVIRAFSGVA